MHVTYDIEFYGPNTMTNTILSGVLSKGVVEMAEHLGKQDDVDAYRYQYGIGCLTDQLLGQFMAQAAGLGYVLPKAHVKKALQSIYKYNFKECMDDVPNVQRTYALNDEAGLVLCSWPKGGRPRFPFAYCDEVWTGVEYQVAVTMIKEGMIEEAFTIIKTMWHRWLHSHSWRQLFL